MSDTFIAGIVLALGVFAGNAFIVPMFTKRTLKEGLAIGVLAAFICLVAYSCLIKE